MIDKEKYGIEAEIETSKAKKSLKDLANFIRNFGKKAKEEATVKPIINPNISKKELLNWREDLQNSIKEAKVDIKNYGNTPTGKFYEEDLKRYQDGLKLVDDRIKEIEQDEENAKQEAEEMSEEGAKSTSVLGELFDKSIGKIKRFTYYLLGARSVFSLFMRYRSIYYQFNEEMQYQSELSQNAIALSLAPAFEFLGNVIAYASIAFAKFIELLTGVNVLSKVSTKGIRDYNKALKESQSLLSGIDEITNLTLPSSTGLASQYKALDEFQKKVEEVEKFFKENKWIEVFVKGLKKIFKWLSDTYNYIHDNWDVFKYIFGGVAIGAILIKIGTSLAGASATLGTVGTLFGLLGTTGTGLLGLASTLKFLAGLGVISLVIALAIPGIKNDLQEIEEKGFKQFFMEKLNQTITQELPKIFKNAYNIGIKWWLEPFANKVKNDLKPIWEPFENYFKLTIDKINKDWVEFFEPKIINPIKDKFNELKGDLTPYLDEIKEIFAPFINELIDLYNKLFGDIFGKIDYIETKTINTDGTLKKDVQNTTKDMMNFINNVKEKMDTTFKTRTFTIKGVVEMSLTKAKEKLNSLLKVIEAGPSIFGPISPSIKNALKELEYAKGLDYVPYDNYPALLHKGETVVPAKYNPTIHSVGNEYTNSLLEEVVIKLDDLSRRPNVFEIDGQQFATATYNLYDNERMRQNYVEGVVR